MMQKGFTLIELLVVVAIIGVLSSVVIASLSDARGKGNTSAIKQNLTSIRTQAEILYSDSFNFSGVCANAIVESARAQAQTLSGGGTATCNDSSSGWAVASDLPGGGAFCVDASGRGRTKNASGSNYGSDLTGGTAPVALDNAGADVDCN